MILHTRTILTSAATHQHNRMLLHIVALAGDISRNNLPTAQPNPRNLPLPRVRLLRLRRAHAQAHALHLGSVDERGRCGFARALLGAAAAQDLVVGCVEGGCGGEGAAGEDAGESGGGGGGEEGAGWRGEAEEGGEEFGGHCCGLVGGLLGGLARLVCYRFGSLEGRGSEVLVVRAREWTQDGI